MIFLELADPIASVARLDAEAQAALVLGVVTNKSGKHNKTCHENLNTLRGFSPFSLLSMYEFGFFKYKNFIILKVVQIVILLHYLRLSGNSLLATYI